jgi:hypothetical protein
MPRRRGLRPRLLAAVIRSKATLAFAAERQVVSRTQMTRISLAAAFLLVVAVPATAEHASALGAEKSKPSQTVVHVDRPTVIVFAPPQWKEDASEGGVETIAHVRFAVDDVNRCRGETPIDVRMVFADRLAVTLDGRRKVIDLSRRFPDAAGAYLFKPGKTPCAFATPNDTAFLGDKLSQAVGQFFEVPACLQKGWSRPVCGGAG